MIESSPGTGKFHVYWLIDALPLEKFSAFQRALVKRFGGDPKPVDLPRVMRLPGFWHQKRGPAQTRIIEAKDREPYSEADFVRALDFDPSERERETRVERPVVQVDGGEASALAAKLATDYAFESWNKPDKGRRGYLLRLGYDLAGRGVPEDVAARAALLFRDHCRDTDSDGRAEELSDREVLDAVLEAVVTVRGPSARRPGRGRRPGAAPGR